MNVHRFAASTAAPSDDRMSAYRSEALNVASCIHDYLDHDRALRVHVSGQSRRLARNHVLIHFTRLQTGYLLIGSEVGRFTALPLFRQRLSLCKAEHDGEQ